MKKGFTLVEIIISIGLILLAGTIVVVNFHLNKIDKDIEGITKKILEAANLYVEVEVDENGNAYADQVIKGAKAVKIPLSNLVNNGYIDSDSANFVYEYGEKNGLNLEDDQDFYVMFLTGDPCDDGATLTVSSWMEAGKTVYLCDAPKKEEQKTEINILDSNKEMSKILKVKYTPNKIPVSEEKYNTIETNYPDKLSYFTKDENGLFSFYNESNSFLYSFYRGVVNNNYLKLGEKNGQPILWRIVWARDNGRMKIVLDDTIPIVLQTKSGEKITYDSGTTIYGMLNNYFTRGDYSSEQSGTVTYYTYKIKDKFNNINNASENYTYSLTLDDWWNSTDLSNYSYIINTNSYCTNGNYMWNSSGTKQTYYPSNNFDCFTNNSSNGRYYQNISDYTSGNLGYLSYGDVYMAGIISNSTGISNVFSENYLFENASYLLSDMSVYRDSIGESGSLSASKTRYVISSNGLTTNSLWSERRYSCRDEYRDIYKLLDVDDSVIFQNKGNACSSGLIIEKSNFNAKLKPTITINTTNLKLSNSAGTHEDPYILESLIES